MLAETRVTVKDVPLAAIKRVEEAMLKAAHEALAEYIDTEGLSDSSDCPDFCCSGCSKKGNAYLCKTCSHATNLSDIDMYTDRSGE